MKEKIPEDKNRKINICPIVGSKLMAISDPLRTSIRINQTRDYDEERGRSACGYKEPETRRRSAHRKPRKKRHDKSSRQKKRQPLGDLAVINLPKPRHE